MDTIKIAAIVNGSKLPAWHHKLLESLRHDPRIDLVSVITLVPALKTSTSVGSYLLGKWLKFDGRKLKFKANAPKKLDNLVEGLSVLKLSAIQQGYSYQLTKEDCRQVKSLDLDLLLNLNDFQPEGVILEAASCGLWHYYHGDYEHQRDPRPGYQEILNKAPYSGTFLLRLMNKPRAHQVLYQSYSYVDNVSLNRTLQNSQWKAISFVLRKLDELHRLGRQSFLQQLKDDNSKLNFFYGPGSLSTPGNHWKMAWVQFLRTLNKKFREKFILETWILMYYRDAGPATNLSEYRKIIPPKDRFWADPFILYQDNKHYIFVEEVVLKKRKGHISVIELDEKGNYTPARKVLERPYHLSYPYLIRWENDLFMIPESSKNETLEVYRCVNFPDKWEHYRTLMKDVQVADATLFHHEDRWWLFANIRTYQGYPNWDELYLFYADKPFSTEWTSHPLNPIISDVRRARPAGKIFEWKGTIYRPSQNCSVRYGYGMRFNEIVKLTPTEYQEKEITCIEPLWDRDIKTVHTFNFEHGVSIIDAKLKRGKYF